MVVLHLVSLYDNMEVEPDVTCQTRWLAGTGDCSLAVLQLCYAMPVVLADM